MQSIPATTRSSNIDKLFHRAKSSIFPNKSLDTDRERERASHIPLSLLCEERSTSRARRKRMGPYPAGKMYFLKNYSSLCLRGSRAVGSHSPERKERERERGVFGLLQKRRVDESSFSHFVPALPGAEKWRARGFFLPPSVGRRERYMDSFPPLGTGPLCGYLLGFG